MTLTPAGAARRANACRNVADLLEQWGAPDTDRRAAQILDAIDAAGWHPPPELVHAPQQASGSTVEGRAKARELFEQTRGRRA